MEELHAFRPVPKTGVIFVTSEATKLGFSSNDPDWCNLGQGQPETGELPGAPARVQSIAIHPDDQEYARSQAYGSSARRSPGSTIGFIAKECRRNTARRTSVFQAAAAPR